MHTHLGNHIKQQCVVLSLIVGEKRREKDEFFLSEGMNSRRVATVTSLTSRRQMKLWQNTIDSII